MIDIYRVISSSRNFTELEMIWKGWRDASGKKMKDKYAEFVKLSNEGIKELNMGMFLVMIFSYLPLLNIL